MLIETDRPIDLSQPIRHDGVSWPQRPPPEIRHDHRIEVEGANVETVTIDTHTGTHVDAPFHFDREAETIETLPLRAFAAPAVFIDLRDELAPHEPISADRLEPYASQLRGNFVVLVTGWGERRRLSREYLFEWPYLDGGGARALVDGGAAGVGIDTLSIGGSAGGEEAEECHRVLLGAGKTVIEELRVDEAVLEGNWFITAFPVLLEGCGGSWVRAVAWPIVAPVSEGDG